ncbi:hypothetical protein ES708_31433 [subsurface metagenome]
MEPFDYFASRDPVIKKKYDALRDFFYNKENAYIVAEEYGYALTAFYSLTKDFRKFLSKNPQDDYFFRNKPLGRKHKEPEASIDQLIIDMRKKNYSSEDILQSMQATGNRVSYQRLSIITLRGLCKIAPPGQAGKSISGDTKTKSSCLGTNIF